jgi:hypothetical protein
MHRTRNALMGALACSVLSQLVLNHLRNLSDGSCSSHPISARATELGSKMVAARFRNVRGVFPVAPLLCIVGPGERPNSPDEPHYHRTTMERSIA